MVQKVERRLQIAGVKVTSTRKKTVIEVLESHLVSRRGGLAGVGQAGLVVVTTPNPEQVVQAQTDDLFRSIVNESEYAVPDGVGLVVALRLLNRFKVKGERFKQIERISGIDLAEELVGYCREKGLGVMLLGGRPGVAAAAATKFQNHKHQISNNIQIQNSNNETSKAGSIDHSSFEIRGISGARDIVHETEAEREETLRQIREFRPALLLVAYGAPWQEKWIAANRGELEKAGVRVVMVVGGAVDVWAGRVKRAPMVVRKAGLEWLWRLGREPWRWRRQLRLFEFVGLVARQIFFTGGKKT